MCIFCPYNSDLFHHQTLTLTLCVEIGQNLHCLSACQLAKWKLNVEVGVCEDVNFAKLISGADCNLEDWIMFWNNEMKLEQ